MHAGIVQSPASCSQQEADRKLTEILDGILSSKGDSVAN